MTTAESYHSTFTNTLIDNSNSTIKTDDPSLIVANVTIDELVESCCNEVLPSTSSSQLNTSSSVSPTHLVRFVHSQSSLVSQIDDTNNNNIQQTPSNVTISSHDIPSIKQTPYINVTRLPSPFSTIRPKTIIESTSSMYNTTNLSNITANNISVNNYNVNIHTTNVQQPAQTIISSNNNTNTNNNNNSDILAKKTKQFDEKQTTEIVTQILKNMKEVDNNNDQITKNYSIHIDSFNFSSSNEQQSILNKKSKIKKEAKALTRIIVKDEIAQEAISPNFLRTKKSFKHPSNNPIDDTTQTSTDFIPVPYGWQRRVLAPDFVVYISPTNTILDSLDAVRQYVESPSSCKCGLQCPLIIEKIFNFDPMKKSKSWEVTQVLEGTNCRQKSNILEMATLTNCIDSFCETEQKPIKRRKRLQNEATNGNVFVCAASNIIGNSNHESVVFVNNADQISENGQSMNWTSAQQTNITPPSKRPRGRPRKTAAATPGVPQLAAKPSADTHQTQPVPSSILSPPASVSSMSQANFVHRNSTSPSAHHPTTNNIRHINDNILTPPILSSTTTTDTNVIARVPTIFDQVKTTTNESTFAVLSGVQNVLLSPNRDSNNNEKRAYVETSSSIVSTAGKQVTLNVNALKPDFVRSASTTHKSSITSNQIDVISLMGTTTQNQLTLPKASTIVTVPSATHDEYSSTKSSVEQKPDSSSQPLMIDFNDPSTTNFLLSALASGASSDSNAIVNHLFQKAQTQQQRPVTSSPPLTLSTITNSPSLSIKKNLPIISSGLKNCTETTNLLPSNTTMRQSVVLHVPSSNDFHQQTQPQQILSSNNSNNNNNEKRQHQPILFINNKPYIIQQKITHDQLSQQRLILTPSITQSHETSNTNRNPVPAINNTNKNNNSSNSNNSNKSAQPTLDDGGNCLLLNGPVEPKTLRTLLKGLNSSSFSGVDNLIDTINRFEHAVPMTEQNDNLMKSIRATKRTATNPDKPPAKRRAPKKLKQTDPPQSHQSVLPPQPQQQIQISLPLQSQPMIVEQQHHWHTDFNTLDFSTSWGSDTNLNSLLLNDDFDTAASFDDVNFGDFEPYMNGNNTLSHNDISLPSLFVKSLPSDSLPNVDHLLP